MSEPPNYKKNFYTSSAEVAMDGWTGFRQVHLSSSLLQPIVPSKNPER